MYIHMYIPIVLNIIYNVVTYTTEDRRLLEKDYFISPLPPRCTRRVYNFNQNLVFCDSPVHFSVMMHVCVYRYFCIAKMPNKESKPPLDCVSRATIQT